MENQLFKFDPDSDLHKDLDFLGEDHVELEMSFPNDYPFAPPFVRVVRPRFVRQTGFVMNGAICSELLTNEGWNPVNDIESVIVSIRSLLVVGNGRLEAAARRRARSEKGGRGGRDDDDDQEAVVEVEGDDGPTAVGASAKRKNDNNKKRKRPSSSTSSSSSSSSTYTASEARAAYAHLSEYHQKKGWDSSGWWARKG